MITSTFPKKSFSLRTSLLAFSCFAALFAQSPAFAQVVEDAADLDQDSTEPQVMEEVMVSGIRRSLDLAADIKRESNSVVDVITATDIGLFSDNNIGEALQRIPGVLLEREAGEGFRVTIRGLGPRFVRTTINGRTALSSSGGETGGGDDARGFTFNIMPSEVVSKATVSKSTQANEIEGGIGGVIDLVTNRPLDFKPRSDDNFFMSASLRATYNDLTEDTNPRASLFLNHKFSENFGVFFGATIDDADRQDNLAESQRLRIFDHDLRAGTVLNGVELTENLSNQDYANFSGVRYQEQPISRDRETYVAGLQWRSGNWDVNFDWTAGFEDEVRDDKRFWYNFGDLTRRFESDIVSLTVDFDDELPDQNVPSLGTIIASESLTVDNRRANLFANTLYRQVPRSSDVNIGGLNVAWSNGEWSFKGDLGYADQETVRVLERLRGRLDLALPRFEDGVSATYDITSGFPIARAFDSFGVEIDPLDTSHQKFNLLERTITPESGEDTSIRLDFSRVLSSGGIDDIMFGFAWNEMKFSRSRTRKIVQDGDPGEFDLTGVRSAFGRGILTDINVPGFVHEFAIPDINDPLFADFLRSPEGYFEDQGSQFDVTEENTAVYIQANFSGEENIRYRGNFGLRYVETDQTNVGWVGQGDEEDFIPADPDNPLVTTARTYDQFLPSFNIALDIGEDKVLRFAANKAVTRPDPIDLSARLDLDDLDDEDERTGDGGNPDLEPYTTYSFDTSLEWYPERGGSYAVGIFFKSLTGYIANGSGLEDVLLSDGAGGSEFVEYEIDRPVNTDGGEIRGVELQFHTPLDFLPGFWQYFGINGSYTYVDAEMDAVIPDRGVPVQLRGTSKNSGNLVLYYEQERFGARLAYNFRDDFLFQEASDNDRFDEFTIGQDILDFNFDWLIRENMKLRFTANNLTDERRGRYWGSPGRYYSDLRDNGRTFVLELRWTSD